jgi:hypothetical protein
LPYLPGPTEHDHELTSRCGRRRPVAARRGDRAGAAKEARIVAVADDYILATVRTQSDDLKMIGYRVDAFGNFDRIGVYTAGKISVLGDHLCGRCRGQDGAARPAAILLHID